MWRVIVYLDNQQMHTQVISWEWSIGGRCRMQKNAYKLIVHFMERGYSRDRETDASIALKWML